MAFVLNINFSENGQVNIVMEATDVLKLNINRKGVCTCIRSSLKYSLKPTQAETEKAGLALPPPWGIFPWTVTALQTCDLALNKLENDLVSGRGSVCRVSSAQAHSFTHVLLGFKLSSNFTHGHLCECVKEE